MTEQLEARWKRKAKRWGKNTAIAGAAVGAAGGAVVAGALGRSKRMGALSGAAKGAFRYGTTGAAAGGLYGAVTNDRVKKADQDTLAKRKAGTPLSEAEIEQRREAARRRWANAAGTVSGAALGVVGAATGSAVGSLMMGPSTSSDPKAKGTLGRWALYRSVKNNRGYRNDLVREARKVREKYVASKAEATGANVMAAAAERKIMEEAAARGDDMQQAGVAAKAFAEKVRARKAGKGPSKAFAEEGSRRAREFMRGQMRAGAAQAARGVGLPAGMKVKRAAGFIGAGAAIGGAAAATAGYVGGKDAVIRTSDKERRVGAIASSASSAVSGAMMAPLLVGASGRSGLLRTMAGGAAVGAALGPVAAYASYRDNDANRVAAAQARAAKLERQRAKEALRAAKGM